MKETAIVNFEIKKGQVDEAKRVICEFVDQVNHREPDTLFYLSTQEQTNPCKFVHFMIFRDGAAHSHHRKTDHVKEFVEKLYPLCVEEPQPVFLAEIAKAGGLADHLK